MEIFLALTSAMLIAVFIIDTSRKRRAYLCRQVEAAKQQPAIGK
jgi:hypothetical protein